jgi:multidrug efflux system outer membrane protein
VGANADAEGALANYEEQVLLPLDETENAFSDYDKRQQRLIFRWCVMVNQVEPLPSLGSLRTRGGVFCDLASIEYREGTVDFLILLDAERERLAAGNPQAQAEIKLYRGLVAIYKALGGGCQPKA